MKAFFHDLRHEQTGAVIGNVYDAPGKRTGKEGAVGAVLDVYHYGKVVGYSS